MLEYALILGLIALVVIAVMQIVGRQTATSLCGVSTGLDNLYVCGNLLPETEASFETGTTGWGAAGNVSIAWSTAVAEDGTHSMSLAPVPAGALFVTTDYGNSAHLPVTSGQQYTLAAYFRSASTSELAGVFIRWYQSDNATVINPDSSMAEVYDNSSGWTRVASTGTAPAGAAYAAVYLSMYPASTVVHYVDRVSLLTPDTTNLLSAPAASFEDGTTGGWTTYNQTQMNSSAQSADGTKSLLCTVSSTNISAVSPSFAVVAGQAYSAVVSALLGIAAGGGTGLGLYIDWLNSSGGTISQSVTSFTITTSWQRIAVQATAPVGTVAARMEVYNGAGANGQIYYLDRAAFIPGTTTTWQPGYAP